MCVLDTMKGKSTIGELMNLPNRIFHTLYHNYYMIEEQRRKRERNQKMTNNKAKPSIPSQREIDDIEDQLEDIM